MKEAFNLGDDLHPKNGKHKTQLKHMNNQKFLSNEYSH